MVYLSPIRYLLFFSIIAFGVLTYLLFNFETLSSPIYSSLIIDHIFIDPYLDFIKAIFFSILLSFFFVKHRVYLPFWAVKVVVTLFLMLFYESHYGLDSFTYFHRGVNFDIKILERYWGEESGTTYLIQFVHYLTYILGDSYYTIKVFFSFIGFLGLIFFYKTYKYISYKNKTFHPNDKFIYVLFLFPSILLWSSTLGKDPLNLFFVSIFIYGFIRLDEKFSVKNISLIAISLICLFYLRIWWVAIMLLPVIMYGVLYPNKRILPIIVVLSPVALYVVLQVFEARSIQSMSDIFSQMTYLSEAFTLRGGSNLKPVEINGMYDYLIQYVPNLFTALYRPMIWEASSIFALLSAIENTVILYFSFKYIIYIFSSKIKYLPYLVFVIIIWSIPYSILSSANLGTGARFKLQVLPLILIIISLLHYSRQKFKYKK